MSLPRTFLRLEGVLDGDGCASVVDTATRRGFAATGVDYPPSYRDNDRTVTTDPALARALFERLRTSLPQELVDEGGVRHRLLGLNDRFRFCRYRGGQSFRVHQDGAHAPAEGVRSRLTVQVYLDDRFVGGRTRFYASRRGELLGAVTPRAGDAIVFDHELWHDGEPVTEGTKHVMRTDVLYERVGPACEAAGEARCGGPDSAVLRGHQGYVFVVRGLSDGALASGSRDRTIRTWARSPSGAFTTRTFRGHQASVVALAELAGGRLVSGSRDRTVRVWKRATGAHRVLVTLEGAVLAVEPVGGEAVACGAADGKISIVGLDGVRHAELAGHTGWVWALARLPDGRLVSASEDGTLRTWDTSSGECLASASPGRGPAHALAVLDGGRVAAGFADGHVVVYHLASSSFEPVAVLQAHDGEVYALHALEDGRLASGGEDAFARVIRVEDGEVLQVTPCGGFVRSLARVPGTDGLAVGSYDGTIRIVTDPRGGNHVRA